MFLTSTIAHELQAEDAWQTSDVEVQASQIQAERDKADMLAKQLQACREEAAWLRSRVCQLQQNKHARASAAARAAAVPPSQVAERQALQQRRQFHANICPPSAATRGEYASFATAHMWQFRLQLQVVYSRLLQGIALCSGPG